MTLLYVSAAPMRQGRIGVRLALGCALLGLLSACGGEDSGGGPVVLPTPSPSPTPSPTPTVTPTPTPTGQVASVDEGTIPGVTAADGVSAFKVTNAGIYMAVRFADETKSDVIVKLRGTPQYSDAWYTATPLTASGSYVDDYAPANPYSESRLGVSFYWAGWTPSEENGDHWGFHTVNNGGVSIIADARHFGHYGIQLVAAGGRSGVVTSRPWIMWYEPSTIGDSGYHIYQDDGAYTGSNEISDRFGTMATPPLPDGASSMISHPDDPELYVAAGNQLFVYGPDKLDRSWTMPEAGTITDMTWVDGKLYFAQASKVYRVNGDTINSVADIGPGLGIEGRFCISRGDIFLPSGEAINILSGTRRNWISKGTLTAQQETMVGLLTGAIGAGIYCSSYASATLIYSYNPIDGKMRAITPLSN